MYVCIYIYICLITYVCAYKSTCTLEFAKTGGGGARSLVGLMCETPTQEWVGVELDRQAACDASAIALPALKMTRAQDNAYSLF